MRNFGTPRATALRHLGLSELAALHLPAGSMGPKIDACARFTAETGHSSAIGALTDAAAVLEGSAGTTITTTNTEANGVTFLSPFESLAHPTH
jgi:carbamate kinase